jgi:hypothetical protein
MFNQIIFIAQLDTSANSVSVIESGSGSEILALSMAPLSIADLGAIIESISSTVFLGLTDSSNAVDEVNLIFLVSISDIATIGEEFDISAVLNLTDLGSISDDIVIDGIGPKSCFVTDIVSMSELIAITSYTSVADSASCIEDITELISLAIQEYGFSIDSNTARIIRPIVVIMSNNIRLGTVNYNLRTSNLSVNFNGE